MFCVQTKADFLCDQLNNVNCLLIITYTIFPRDTVMLFYPYSSSHFWIINYYKAMNLLDKKETRGFMCNLHWYIRKLLER